ncbi:NAD-dependent SIR2 family protein deacetylase [Thermosipho japonicus]|uniref:NAD-dependent SIR2 family protein deacetylase n=1 Tax=Thermosipho japonicus TaxID=90323 RepID=A0A841GTT4_9BACT|nr:hypothetical protein [Thermosipho japonicus]MBB6062820.1 NAD-dependent SIR2 family protein deacetylase [Thermosipho japonicus]
MIENVFLIGNGFNYSILEFVDDGLKERIKGIISLWSRFEQFFSEIRKIEKYKDLTDENIIDIINHSLEILGKLPLVKDEDLKGCLQKFKKEFFVKINNELLKIVEKFIEAEKKGLHQYLVTFYYQHTNYNIYEFVKNNNISVYTTNYDGIAEMIVGYDKNGNKGNTRIKLRDMFGGGENDYNIFAIDNYFRDYEKSKLIHLHGSYKYFSFSGKFIKMKKRRWDFYYQNKTDLTPVIVFNAPKLKEDQIKGSLILSKYFELFKEELRKAKNLIIWGQSLKNDLYIEDIIRKFFIEKYYNKQKNKQIIIVDIEKKHKIEDACKNKNIVLKYVNPKDFNNLKDLFENIGANMI